MTLTYGDGTGRRFFAWSRQGISIQELQQQVAELVALVNSTDEIAEGQAQTPLFLATVNGAYPARPATARPIIFTDPAVRPPATGSTAGGGGMVPALDMWLS